MDEFLLDYSATSSMIPQDLTVCSSSSSHKSLRIVESKKMACDSGVSGCVNNTQSFDNDQVSSSDSIENPVDTEGHSRGSVEIISLLESDEDGVQKDSKSNGYRYRSSRSGKSPSNTKSVEVIFIEDDADTSTCAPDSPADLKPSGTLGLSRSDLLNMKKEIKWQEAKIVYLETELSQRYVVDEQLRIAQEVGEIREKQIKQLTEKIAERYNLEGQLDRAREKIQGLENSEVNLKRELTKMKLVEWECQYLNMMMNKTREENKRTKESFENQINVLTNSEDVLKKENEKLLADKKNLEKNMALLKQKLLMTEDKLKKAEKPASGPGSSDLYCCNIKDKLVDLLDNEYTCSICGDMFINATITECNHIFCKHCLGDWKKRSTECPICRANATKECKANIIDECISSITKLISDSKHEERLKLIKERKAVEEPPAKRAKVSDFLGLHQQEPLNYRPNVFIRQANLFLHHPDQTYFRSAPEIVPPRHSSLGELIGGGVQWL